MNPKLIPVHNFYPLSAVILAMVAATSTATVPAAANFSKTALTIAAQPARSTASGNRSEVDQLWRNGIRHYQAKQFRESVAPLVQLTSLEPDNYKARVLLGGAYFELKEYPNAAAQFQRATQINPKASSAWSLFGNAQNQLKQYQEAIPAFVKALELDAKNADALLGSGVAYYNTQQYELAIAAYQAYTAVLPGKVMGYAYLGDAYRRHGDKTAAIAAYEKALSLDANQAIAKTGLEKAKAMKP
jgi:tetratricopeptide (TPR) repeat protein